MKARLSEGLYFLFCNAKGSYLPCMNDGWLHGTRRCEDATSPASFGAFLSVLNPHWCLLKVPVDDPTVALQH